MSLVKGPALKPTAQSKSQAWEQVRRAIAADLAKSLKKARNSMEADYSPEILSRAYHTTAVAIEWGMDFLSLPLFETEGDRSRWDIYLEGTRGLVRDFRSSYLLAAIFPLFKLSELGEKTSSLGGEALKMIHSADLVLRALDEYVENSAKAQEILKGYNRREDGILAKVYATLATWEEDEDLNSFSQVFERLLEQSITVVIEGPIQLYLMLSKDGVMLILKALSAVRPDDPQMGPEQLAAALILHETLQSRLRDSKVRECTVEMMRGTLATARQEWVSRQEELRSLFPTPELKKGFVERFEKGEIFGEAKE